MMNMNGLTTVNVELTSRCNKSCHMCGRRKIDRDHPEIAMNYGDMDFNLIEKLSTAIPEKLVVQLHNNGEPLLYPQLGEALKLFGVWDHIRCFNTNGKLLVEKANEIIDNTETITISVIENDPEADEQYEIVKEFLSIKKDKKPYVVYRCLGDVDIEKWEKLPGLIVKRVLHNPMGSFNYKKEPTIPEIGICWDMLNHLAINRFGKVSICVRFDPKGLGVIGDINNHGLQYIWDNPVRKKWEQYHIEGRRDLIPLCSYCHFWGVPTG